eukprot:2533739-Prymnesium_polylepis.1
MQSTLLPNIMLVAPARDKLDLAQHLQELRVSTFSFSNEHRVSRSADSAISAISAISVPSLCGSRHCEADPRQLITGWHDVIRASSPSRTVGLSSDGNAL